MSYNKATFIGYAACLIAVLVGAQLDSWVIPLGYTIGATGSTLYIWLTPE